MGYRSYPRARVESAAVDCVGAALPLSSMALPRVGVAAGVYCYLALGTSTEIGAAAT